MSKLDRFVRINHHRVDANESFSYSSQKLASDAVYFFEIIEKKWIGRILFLVSFSFHTILQFFHLKYTLYKNRHGIILAPGGVPNVLYSDFIIILSINSIQSDICEYV